jgi:hypothetical protein
MPENSSDLIICLDDNINILFRQIANEMAENSSDLIICLDDNINIGYHITNIINKDRHEKCYSSGRSKSSEKKFEPPSSFQESCGENKHLFQDPSAVHSNTRGCLVGNVKFQSGCLIK